MTETVQPMKKVRLLVANGNAPRTTSSGDPVSIEFIFGIASDGICSFENALRGTSQGDVLKITVPSVSAREYFGHCLLDFRQVLGLEIMPPTINLELEVVAVSDPENREVVQALAKALSHGGCGGSCDCGCG